MAPGFARSGYGGSLILRTGFGFATSSGLFDLSTANAGKAGNSGMVSIFTGTTSAGNSGHIRVETGVARSGRGGYVHVMVGTGNSGTGGNIQLAAGKTLDTQSGGIVTIMTGFSTATSSGDFMVETANAGENF